MHRFFVPPECLAGEKIVFPPQTARQIQRVLRLKPGQVVAVVCPQKEEGVEYRIELEETPDGKIAGTVRSVVGLKTEPVLQLTLYLALSQREKFEWMLQKCTEAGASGFVPLISSRTLVQDQGGVEKKLERWGRILQEAAEQSGRGRIPALFPARQLESALPHAQSTHDLVLLAWEGEKTTGLYEVRRRLKTETGKPSSVAVFIGPEGGFDEHEVELAVQNGALPFTLGPRTLRMETAALAATLLVLYEFETRAGC